VTALFDVPEDKRQLTMPTNYSDWVENVERVHDAIGAITYAMSFMTAELVKRTPTDGIYLHTDDVPTLTALRELAEAWAGLDGFMIGVGADISPAGRGQQLRDARKVIHEARTASRVTAAEHWCPEGGR
jgi:hypothetical protein